MVKENRKRESVKNLLPRIILLLALGYGGISCSPVPTVQSQDYSNWTGMSVEFLDDHPFFNAVPMFRTKTGSGTEIRNYAYGYDFGECFTKAGATIFGDFVHEDEFIFCSSSRIICNNIFYIKEEKILEYAPTGRCGSDKRVQPLPSVLKSSDP